MTNSGQSPTAPSAAATPSRQVPTDRADLVRLLAERRERSGLSVRDVAKACGLPLSTVGGYLSGKHLPPRATIGQFAQVLSVLGLDDDEVDDWLEAVARLRRLPGPRSASAPAPYRGLAYFDVEDSALFFGRDQLTATLVDRVTGAPTTPVVVLGSSGAGKSSLLRAGLVANLRAQGRSAVVVTPGSDGRAVVDEAVAQLGGDEAAARAGAVLVIDQFEEALLGDQGTGGPVDADFVGRLAALHGHGVVVVLALRADVVDRALADRRLASWLAERPVPVSPMTATDLRRAVVEPARVVGIEIDEALVAAVVADATRNGPTLEPGVLPLASYALYATWAASPRRRLTLDQYQEVGQLAGAIAQTAEASVAGLPDDALPLVRGLLLRLVEMRGTLMTRGALTLADLTGEERDIVDALLAARLLTTDGQQVRLAHEALLSAWPRLAQWIEADRATLQMRSQVAEAARAWIESGRDDDLLYRGAALAAAQVVLEAPHTPADDDREFLAAGRALHERREVARRRSGQRLRGLAAALAVLALTTSALAADAVVSRRAADLQRDEAISRQLAVTADRLADTDPALAAQVATAAYGYSPTVEARSALMSVTGMPVPRRLGLADGLTNGLAVNPEGSVLAAATDQGGVELWSVQGDAQRFSTSSGGDSALYRLTFTPDGSRVLAGGDGGQLRVWDVTDPIAPTALPVTGDPIGATLYDIVTSTDGTLVAGAASDGTVHLWHLGDDRATPVATLTATPGSSVQAVALAPGSAILAAAGADGQLMLWDVRDPAAPAPLGTPTALSAARITSLDVAPDGSTLAAGALDGTVRLVDISDPASSKVTATLDGPSSWVNDVAFSPNGSKLAAASSDKRVWVWDTSTHARAGLLNHPQLVVATQWTPDGTGLYSGGSDRILRRWDVPGSVLGGFASAAGQGAFDGDLVVTATVDGLRVWDAADPRRVHPLGAAPAPDGARLDGSVAVSASLQLAVAGDTTGTLHAWDVSDPAAPRLVGSVQAHDDWIETVAFDASGRRMAVSSDDGTVTTWDLSEGLPPAPTGRIDLAGGAVYAVQFSPPGTALVASAFSGSVRLVDTTDLKHPTQIGTPIVGPGGDVTGAAFSPDGLTIAATGTDGSVWLWDVSDRTAPIALGDPIRIAGATGMYVAFSPDGSRLAAGLSDGTVRLWDVTEPASPTLWSILSGPEGTVYGVEFSADGRQLSAGAADRTVRLWDVTLGGAQAAACAADGMPMTADEWTLLAGELTLPRACV